MRDIEQDRDTALEDDIRSLVARRIESHDTGAYPDRSRTKKARASCISHGPQFSQPREPEEVRR